MTSQQKSDVAAAVALYAQLTGLPRFAIRKSPELLAKAIAHRAESMATAKKNRSAWKPGDEVLY